MYRTAVDKYLGRRVPGREVPREIRLTNAQISKRGREVAGREVLKEIRPTSAQIYRRGREVPGREVPKPMPTTNCVPYGQCLGLQVWPTNDQAEE